MAQFRYLLEAQDPATLAALRGVQELLWPAELNVGNAFNYRGTRFRVSWVNNVTSRNRNVLSLKASIITVAVDHSDDPETG